MDYAPLSVSKNFFFRVFEVWRRKRSRFGRLWPSGSAFIGVECVVEALTSQSGRQRMCATFTRGFLMRFGDVFIDFLWKFVVDLLF